jgi:hypothetical protein
METHGVGVLWGYLGVSFMRVRHEFIDRGVLPGNNRGDRARGAFRHTAVEEKSLAVP